MSIWTSKDPEAVTDYQYTIPLDAGDAVDSYTLVRLAGSVTIDSHSNTGPVVTAWLSGGVDGETSVFRIAWVTTASRDDDDVITLFVSSHEYETLLLTGYAKPLPPHLKARYPAFAAVEAGTIQYWLTDAERYVTMAWSQGDYAAALMALAAHNMALAGLGTDGAALSGVPAGITRMKSASFELGFTDAAANARMSGTLASTRYGQEYESLLQRNRGGPRVAPTGIPVEAVYPGVWP